MATCFDLFGSIFSKHALTNRFVSVVGNISQMKDSPSHMWDCINTFNTCTFENIHKIEDELYNFSKNEYETHF